MTGVIKECRYRQESGNCAILEQASMLLKKPITGKPVCRYPKKSTDECSIAEDWQSLPDSRITSQSQIYPPMGEID